MYIIYTHIYIYTVHVSLGTNTLQRCVWGGGSVQNPCLSCTCAETPIEANSFSSSPLICTELFHDAGRWPHSFSRSRGKAFCCGVSSTQSWHLLRSSNLAACGRSGLWFHVWCWQHKLLLAHPYPAKGDGLLTETCTTVLTSYIWIHGLVFQRPVIPKPFLLKILFRVSILTLTLKKPRETFSEAVSMHKWAVKKAKMYFL